MTDYTKFPPYRSCRVRDDAPIAQAGQFAAIVRCFGERGDADERYSIRCQDGSVQAQLPRAYLERFVY